MKSVESYRVPNKRGGIDELFDRNEKYQQIHIWVNHGPVTKILNIEFTFLLILISIFKKIHLFTCLFIWSLEKINLLILSFFRYPGCSCT